MVKYATVTDIANMFRPLTSEEQTRANYLIDAVCSEIRLKAKAQGKDFDAMVAADEDLAEVAKAVTVDTVGRVLNQSTTSEPFSQTTESALGYSVTGTYLVPGGGTLLLNRDLKRLGLLRQRISEIDIWGVRALCSGEEV
jgi:hypothetical protein